MKKTLIFISCAAALAAAYLLGSISVKNLLSIPTEDNQIENITARADIDTAKLYGKIVKIDNSNMQLQLVEWVSGSDNQEQAAIETGRCTLERIEKNECLPNPFFVRETQKIIDVPVASNIDIRVVSPGPSGEIKQDQETNTIPRQVSITDFAKMLERTNFASETIFIFTTKKGKIIKMEEQYIP